MPFFTDLRTERNDKKMVYSSYRKEEYDNKDSIRILNAKQAAFYWTKGVRPYDVYPTLDFKTDEPVIAFIFSRKATKILYDEWCKRGEDS